MAKFLLEERHFLREFDDPRDSLAEPSATDRAASTGELDWAKEYKNCKTSEDFKVFWDGIAGRRPGYFEAVWKKNAQHVRALGNTFRETLTEYGWTADQNPLVAFLELVAEADGALKLKHITPLSFKNLVTAYKQGRLSDEAFTTGGKYGIYNLIFNPNFYFEMPTEQKELLAMQHAVESFLSPANKGQAWANIYSEDGNMEDLSAPIKPGRRLRALTEIKRAVRILRPNKSDLTNETDDPDESDSWVSRIKDAGEARKILAYLFDIYLFQRPAVAKRADKETHNYISNLHSKLTMDADDINSLISKYRLRTAAVSDPDEATQLLISLAAKSGWKKN